MPRRVSMSEQAAGALLEYRKRAAALGLLDEFRMAWRTIWENLNSRPLPPDESTDTFGDLHYTTRNPPIHKICMACISPLSIRFAIHESENESGEIDQTVTIIGAIALFESG